jgi:PAS domain S-box-containing protein
VIHTLLRLLSLGLHVILLCGIGLQLRYPYRFPRWTRGWSFLFVAILLQTERRAYEFYWLDADLRTLIVTTMISLCMVVGFWDIWRILRGNLGTPTITPLAHITVDQFSRILAWDAAATQLFGWEPAEVLGQTLMQTVIPVRDWERHRAGVARVLALHPLPIVVLEGYALNARRKQGDEVAVKMTVYSVVAPDGTVTFTAELRRLGVL